MKYAVTACLNVFNEATTLEESMRSVAPFVDRILIIDGAYKDFPYNGNNGASDDGTLELVRRLQKEWDRPVIELVEAPAGGWENEMVKRTVYCDLVEEGAWLFILDADETVAFGGEVLTRLHSFNEIRPFEMGTACERHHDVGGKPSYGCMGRVYKKKKGMKYDQSHSHVVFDGGYLWRELHLPIVLEEHHENRPEARNKQRLDFYASGKMR